MIHRTKTSSLWSYYQRSALEHLITRILPGSKKSHEPTIKFGPFLNTRVGVPVFFVCFNIQRRESSRKCLALYSFPVK